MKPHPIKVGFIFCGYLLLMKYIISESQAELLKEQDLDLWVRRRATPDKLRSRMDNSIELHANPCNWDSEFDYAQDVIDWVVTDFIATYEELFPDDYDEYYTILMDLCKTIFAEELFEIYRTKCSQV